MKRRRQNSLKDAHNSPDCQEFQLFQIFGKDRGSPRIVGELGKLGITVAKSTVEKYRPRVCKSPSPTWRAFLANHVKDLVACDFFTVPTANCHVLFVFIMLAHERRRIVHFNVTEHPTAQWTAHQVVDAFPWDTAPRYLRAVQNSCN
jgi:hypothetical protein